MKRALAVVLVLLWAACTNSIALALQDTAITDSSGKVVLENADKDSIPKLVELLGDNDYQVRKQAQERLVTFGGEAVPALLEALEKGDPPVWALASLGYIRDERAVGPVSRLLNSSSRDVADAASGALLAIGNPAVSTLAGLLGKEGYGKAAAHTLKGIGPSGESLKVVRPLLKSEDRAVRAWSAEVLGSWKDRGSLDGIKALLTDARAEVREKAVVSYRLVAEQYDLDLLLRLADDESGLVRREAMAMMAKDPSSRVVEPMLRRMESAQDPKERAAAMAAAGYTKAPRLIAPFIKALDDPDDLVVGEAVYFLGYQGTSRSRPDIISLFKRRREFKDPMVIQNACEALIKFGGPMEPGDLHLFLPYLEKGRDYDTKYGVLDLLEKYAGKDDEAAVKALDEFLSRETDQTLLMRARSIRAGLR